MENKIKPMNKKGSGFMAFLTTAMVYGFIVFIIFSIVLAGGGFQALWNFGATLKMVPSWAWLVIGVFVLVKWLGGKK